MGRPAGGPPVLVEVMMAGPGVEIQVGRSEMVRRKVLVGLKLVVRIVAVRGF